MNPPSLNVSGPGSYLVGGGAFAAEMFRLTQPNQATLAVKQRELLTEKVLARDKHKAQSAAFLVEPANSQPLRVYAAIPLPAAGAGNVAVLTYRVPVGYYGRIQSTQNGYGGQGFSEGSGNLTWSLQFGLPGGTYPFYQYGNIIVSLGSTTNQQSAFSDGFYIRENQYIVYYVNNAAGSAVLPGGNAICSLIGWIAPL